MAAAVPSDRRTKTGLKGILAVGLAFLAIGTTLLLFPDTNRGPCKDLAQRAVRDFRQRAKPRARSLLIIIAIYAVVLMICTATFLALEKRVDSEPMDVGDIAGMALLAPWMVAHKTWQQLPHIMRWIAHRIWDVVTWIVDRLWDVGEWCIRQVGRFFRWLGPHLGNALRWVWHRLGDAWHYLSEAVHWAWMQVCRGMKWVWSCITTLAEWIWGWIRYLSQGCIDTLRFLWRNTYRYLVKPAWDACVLVYTKVSDMVARLWTACAELTSRVYGYMSDTWERLGVWMVRVWILAQHRAEVVWIEMGERWNRWEKQWEMWV